MNRTELREKIMIILYQIDLYKKKKIEYDVNEIIKENLNIKNEFVNKIVNGVLSKEDYLIKIINDHLNEWTLDRLGSTDQAILKMSTYELLFFDTPNLVVINEAIELAKKYSDDKVVSMINAVLDSLLDEEINE